MYEDTPDFSSSAGRVPPHDNDAEMSTLGAMMLSSDAVADVVNELGSRDFYAPAHEMIFDAIVELYSSGYAIDHITVADELTKRGDLERVGGRDYLMSLSASVPTAANASYYATIVREKAIFRRLVDAGIRVTQLGFTTDVNDVDAVVNEAQGEIYSVAQKRNQTDYVRIGAALPELNLEIESAQNRDTGIVSGVPTGFTELDELTGGLHGGQMIIVAARPAMGKSTLALDFCRSASITHRITSCYFSLEMGRMEIMMRMMAAQAGVSLNKLRGEPMDDRDWTRMGEQYGAIEQAPLFIDDSPNLTMPEIRSKCRRLKQQDNLGLMVIDYLQLMSSGKRVESRQQEVSDFSRSLKLLAKELDIPVVAVAQLNRGPENRTGNKPQMSDLRESGSLEQDADIIMLLHRPEYYDNTERPGEADIIVAKHRNGATKTIPVSFQGHMARFANMARDITAPVDPFEG